MMLSVYLSAAMLAIAIRLGLERGFASILSAWSKISVYDLRLAIF